MGKILKFCNYTTLSDSPFFASIMNGQLFSDALLSFERVPVQLGLLQSAHFRLLYSNTAQDTAHPCWSLHALKKKKNTQQENFKAEVVSKEAFEIEMQRSET